MWERRRTMSIRSRSGMVPWSPWYRLLGRQVRVVLLDGSGCVAVDRVGGVGCGAVWRRHWWLCHHGQLGWSVDAVDFKDGSAAMLAAWNDASDQVARRRREVVPRNKSCDTRWSDR